MYIYLTESLKFSALSPLIPVRFHPHPLNDDAAGSSVDEGMMVVVEAVAGGGLESRVFAGATASSWQRFGYRPLRWLDV